MKSRTYEVTEFPEKHHGDRYYMVAWQKDSGNSHAVSVRLGGIGPLQDLLSEAGYKEAKPKKAKI